MTITSSHNEKLKTLRKLRQRRRDRERLGQFVAEGEDLLAAADAAGWVPVERFAISGSGLPGTEVDPEALRSVTELASGTRTLAIYNERWEAGVGGTLSRLLLYLHGVSDPGNVGTVLRSAAAFGAGCVALGPGSADPFGPKAVRASMGAIFAVPVAHATPQQLPGTTLALDARAQRTLAEVAGELPADAPVSLLIGAEREGLPAEVIAACDHTARIQITTESLNAAIAAAVALYELTRRIRPA
ncbi:MAG TPA: RNA methyltransferase [Solirubrobacteraceae bacterium]|jgi:TrmH family RNA methyltransferase|nr:RNA methyltransferase [Solirubrobacteraceae bacterium]